MWLHFYFVTLGLSCCWTQCHPWSIVQRSSVVSCDSLDCFVSCIVKQKSLYGQGVVQMCSAWSHHASVGDAEVSCWRYCTGTVWFIFSLPLLSLGVILSETCECHCAVPWPAFVQCLFIILLECNLLWQCILACVLHLCLYPHSFFLV